MQLAMQSNTSHAKLSCITSKVESGLALDPKASIQYSFLCWSQIQICIYLLLYICIAESHGARNMYLNFLSTEYYNWFSKIPVSTFDGRREVKSYDRELLAESSV